MNQDVLIWSFTAIIACRFITQKPRRKRQYQTCHKSSNGRTDCILFTHTRHSLGRFSSRAFIGFLRIWHCKWAFVTINYRVIMIDTSRATTKKESWIFRMKQNGSKGWTHLRLGSGKIRRVSHSPLIACSVDCSFSCLNLYCLLPFHTFYGCFVRTEERGIIMCILIILLIIALPQLFFLIFCHIQKRPACDRCNLLEETRWKWR